MSPSADVAYLVVTKKEVIETGKIRFYYGIFSEPCPTFGDNEFEKRISQYSILSENAATYTEAKQKLLSSLDAVLKGLTEGKETWICQK